MPGCAGTIASAGNDDRGWCWWLQRAEIVHLGVIFRDDISESTAVGIRPPVRCLTLAHDHRDGMRAMFASRRDLIRLSAFTASALALPTLAETSPVGPMREAELLAKLKA